MTQALAIQVRQLIRRRILSTENLAAGLSSTGTGPRDGHDDADFDDVILDAALAEEA